MYHILIAEDERIERMALSSLLRETLGPDYQLHEAENGRAAIELFRQFPMGLAVLDIEMPVMSGIAAAQIIHREAPDCAILFLTAYDRFDYAREAMRVRALDYLLKPYADDEILAAVESAIHNRRRTVLPAQSPKEEASADRGTAVMNQMADYVRTHYQQEISMQDAACALNYSEPYFCTLFKQQFGQSFTAYLTAYRMERARELLAQPTVNIKEVGKRVGYPDANYFSKVFRRVTGCSPSEYRENCAR